MEIVSAIIPAAGRGQRFGAKKQFEKLNGLPLVFYSLNQFYSCDKIDEIILIVPKTDIQWVKRKVSKHFIKKPILTIEGGHNRQSSVENGIKVSNSNLVCIHDAARPFLTQEIINNSIKGCKKADGAIAAIPSSDTIKIVHEDYIKSTIDRERVWLAQTPQTFHKAKLSTAIESGKKNNLFVTDESMLMEEMGFKVKLVNGDENNFKITTKKDWDRAEKLIQ